MVALIGTSEFVLRGFSGMTVAIVDAGFEATGQLASTVTSTDSNITPAWSTSDAMDWISR